MGCCSSSEDDLVIKALRIAPHVLRNDMHSVVQLMDLIKSTSSGQRTSKREVSNVIETLIPVDGNRQLESRETLLHMSIRLHHVTMVKYFVSHEPKMRRKNTLGNEVLHMLCLVGSPLEVVEAICSRLNQDAFESTNEDGDMPIHIAAKNRFGWIVKGLIDCGADGKVVNGDNCTPMQCARVGAVPHPRRHMEWWDPATMTFEYLQKVLSW